MDEIKELLKKNEEIQEKINEITNNMVMFLLAAKAFQEKLSEMNGERENTITSVEEWMQGYPLN